MLKIRLARLGKKKKPIYRIVVSEHTKDMYGNHLEILGNYNPHTKEIVLKGERIKYWLSVGAQTSNIVNNLLIKENIITGQKGKAVKISKKRKIKLEEKKNEKEKKKEEREGKKEIEIKKEVKEDVNKNNKGEEVRKDKKEEK